MPPEVSHHQQTSSRGELKAKSHQQVLTSAFILAATGLAQKHEFRSGHDKR
jgi:hypothetical protein